MKNNCEVILDWNEYIQKAREVSVEGCVLIENRHDTLPFSENTRVSVFGRIQTHYYKSGTGSGGMVNVSKVCGILEALFDNEKISVNEKLLGIYKDWESSHPFNEGEGWGGEPWSQEEMPLTDEIVYEAAKDSDAAVVIIGRTAGEDRDAKDEPGSNRLTDLEEDMLCKVRKSFDKVVVLLNVGSIMDMSFVDKYSPDSVMYVWQGGMIGGLGVADILTGMESPSGKLTDTIAYAISDYPSDDNFGGYERNFYKEDIYVGYRFFETAALNKVRYPFGYGLSYTDFAISTVNAYFDCNNKVIHAQISVKNTGKYNGKETVQIYGEPPKGALLKPARNLIDFKKTVLLASGISESIIFDIPIERLASYDDSGVSGHKSCFILEPGSYKIYCGSDVRSAECILEFMLPELIVTDKLQEALAPVLPFKRLNIDYDNNRNAVISYEDVPLATKDMDERRKENIPPEITPTGDRGIKLIDVKEKRASMEEFVAQMSDDDLSCIVRGEGMGSSLVTPGTASAFGGVSKGLSDMGIPAVCCDDGPSGMRLDCGTKAFSLPNGTMMGCTFNPELIKSLYRFTGLEMINNKVECLLGPGMNLHRHPLNGRNFEYFSEDPYLTGIMASAQVKGLKEAGVTGTIKHFAGNNQEYRRRQTDSVISERALRELYLKSFEIAIKEGGADSVMTTYGSLNGLWTAGSYDLTTTILREQWGFEGIVMTDWWAEINERNKPQDQTNFAAMVRAQNDIYMVCPDGSTNAGGDNTLKALKEGFLARSELQRSAMNICRFVMNTEAMRRLCGRGTDVKIINRPDEDKDEFDMQDVEFVEVDGEIVFPLTDKPSKSGTSYILPFDMKQLGKYEVTVTGKSDLSEIAQIPCTLFYTGIPCAGFTFNGTGGKEASLSKEIVCNSRFSLMRLYVGGSGLDLQKISFRIIKHIEDMERGEW